MQICILGRQPELGIAELEAAIGAESIEPFGDNCAIIKKPEALVQQELGGTIKICNIISTVTALRWNIVSSTIRNRIVNYLREHFSESDHKLTVGLSVYGISLTQKQIWRLSFAIRDKLKAKGYSVKLVLGKEPTLNSAQVIHNKLNGSFGSEFVLAANSKEIHIARTTSIQDIESYSKRDYDRPKRDAEVGMLPPKLAQIMLNLARVNQSSSVLDPFCGTGVVLMEAALKSSKISGSDLNPKMLEYTKTNLEWLSKEYKLDIKMDELIRADATTYKWKSHFDSVVTETYLGPQFSYIKEGSLKGVVDDCNLLIQKFLVNLRPQLIPKSYCCIAVPAWNFHKRLVHLPVIEHLEELGYKRVEFSHVNFDQMVYRRPNQVVARELLVLTTR